MRPGKRGHVVTLCKHCHKYHILTVGPRMAVAFYVSFIDEYAFWHGTDFLGNTSFKYNRKTNLWNYFPFILENMHEQRKEHIRQDIKILNIKTEHKQDATGDYCWGLQCGHTWQNLHGLVVREMDVWIATEEGT